MYKGGGRVSGGRGAIVGWGAGQHGRAGVKVWGGGRGGRCGGGGGRETRQGWGKGLGVCVCVCVCVAGVRSGISFDISRCYCIVFLLLLFVDLFFPFFESFCRFYFQKNSCFHFYHVFFFSGL